MSIDLTGRRWPTEPTVLERDAVVRALNSRQWTGSTATERVEEQMRDLTRARYAVAFNSCTSAIHAALAAHGVTQTSTVTTTPLTFIGTVTGAGHLGVHFRYIDVDPHTLNIDRLPAPGPTIAVDLHGVPHSLHRSQVITDACQSLGTYASEGGGPYEHIGRYGTHCWSFSSAKLVAAPDGGAVTTNDPVVHAQLRQFRDYSAVPTGEPGRANGLVHDPRGHNWRPSELTMALVSARLDRLPELAAQANRTGNLLHECIDTTTLWSQAAGYGMRPAWHKIRIGPADWAEDPDAGRRALELRHRLHRLGIPTHVWGRFPLNEHPAYRGEGDTPVAYRAARNTFCLGTEECPPMTWTDEEIDHVANALATVGKA